MRSVLQQPYPYYNSFRKIPGNTLLIFISVTFFLYFFRPFGVNESEHLHSYFVICVLHGANAALVYALFFSLLNLLGGSWIREEHWKIYKTILAILSVFLLIGVGSFLLRPFIYSHGDNNSWRILYHETRNTVLAGTLVFGGFTLVDFYRLLKKNRADVAAMKEELAKHGGPGAQDTPTAFTLRLDSAELRINPAEFLFARAEGNYVNFYFLRDNVIQKQLLRATLKAVAEQVGDHGDTLLRVHRTFLVNTEHIQKMSGNAQGYQLYFPQVDFAVPVSRSYLSAFRQGMEKK